MNELMAPRRNRVGSDDGFTLVELLVVIAILGILAAVAVFAIGGTTAKSKTAACKSDLIAVQTASDAYTAQSPTNAVAGSITALVPTYLRSAPSSTNGYVISLSSVGLATVVPGLCVVT